MSNIVTYTFSDGVATIVMDDGKANALSHTMWDELEAAFDRAEESKAIVILKGRDGLFSGGFDLKEMAKGPDQAVLLTSRGSKMARRIMAFPTPVIGLSTGHCIAMGAFLMLACDYRISPDGAFKTGLNETLIGMTMHHFGIELARYRIPLNYFNRCVINAEIWSPQNAVQAGFYDQLVPVDQLDTTANAIAKGFSLLNMTAFQGTKVKSRAAFLTLLDECIASDMLIPDNL
jgi:enoyl-CoA hydratase